jgi:predicted dehydrogenase
MSKVGLGLLGFGAIARKHLATMRDCPDVEITGVFDRLPAAREAAAHEGLRSFATLNEFFGAAGLAGVIVATPNQHHAEGAIACIERRLPVLVEKPVADTVANGKRILAAYRAAGTPILVGHHRRHNPIVQKAREIVRSGRLGRVTAVVGLTLFLKPREYFDLAWRRKPGGGPVLINLIHDIDNLRFIVGEIASVEAMTSNERRRYPVEDTAAIVARFESGALATMLVSDIAAAPWSWELTAGENPVYPQQAENCYLIAGTEASLALPRLQLWSYPAAPGWDNEISKQVVPVEPAEPFRLQLRHFIDVVRGAAEPLVSVEDALRTLEVASAIARLETGAMGT